MHDRWRSELDRLSEKNAAMKQELRAKLEELATPGSWDHITDGPGKLPRIGLSPKQCARLEREFHFHLPERNRVSLVGFSKQDVQHFAECIDKVVRDTLEKEAGED